MIAEREAAFDQFWRETFAGIGDAFTNKAVRAMCHAAYSAGATKLPERYELHTDDHKQANEEGRKGGIMTDQEAMSAAFDKHWNECWRGVVRGEEEGKTKPVARECFFAGWILRNNKTNKEGKAEL